MLLSCIQKFEIENSQMQFLAHLTEICDRISAVLHIATLSSNKNSYIDQYERYENRNRPEDGGINFCIIRQKKHSNIARENSYYLTTQKHTFADGEFRYYDGNLCL